MLSTAEVIQGLRETEIRAQDQDQSLEADVGKKSPKEIGHGEVLRKPWKRVSGTQESPEKSVCIGLCQKPSLDCDC